SLNTPNVLFSGQKDTRLFLKVTTPAGCEGQDSLEIKVHKGNFASLTPVDTAICPNNTVQMHISSGVLYDWQPAKYLSDASSASPVVAPITDVDYVATVFDQYGCQDTVYSSIRVHSDAVVNLPDSVEIYPGEQVQMDPRGNALYYQW